MEGELLYFWMFQRGYHKYLQGIYCAITLRVRDTNSHEMFSVKQKEITKSQWCSWEFHGGQYKGAYNEWGPGAHFRAPGGVQGWSPWWGSRRQSPAPCKLWGFSPFECQQYFGVKLLEKSKPRLFALAQAGLWLALNLPTAHFYRRISILGGGHSPQPPSSYATAKPRNHKIQRYSNFSPCVVAK